MSANSELFGWALTECLYTPPLSHTPNTLLGHVPIITLLTRLAAPNIVVDLGVANSSTLESVSSAVKHFKLDTSCYGVFDGREDDDNSEIRHTLKSVSNNYPQSSVIIGDPQTTADLFEENSIDILTISHIPDREKIKSIISEWTPKLSESGIIILATINHPNPNDPINLYWKDLKKEFPSFELLHQFGLGILFVGTKQTKLIQDLIDNLNNNQYFTALFSSMCEYNGVVMQERLNPQAVSSVQQLNHGRSEVIVERADQLFKHSRTWKLLAPFLRRTTGFRRLEEATR